MRKESTEQQRSVGGGNGEADISAASSGTAVDDASPSPSSSVTLYDVVQRLWTGRRSLLLIIGAFVLAGGIFLAGSRSEYRSGAVLLPERLSNEGIGNLGVLNQFGGLLGNSIPSELFQSSTDIPAELYPELARSTALQLALLKKEIFVPSERQRMTLYRYLESHKPFSLWASLSGLPSAFLEGDGDPKDGQDLIADTSIIHLTRGQRRVVEDLRDRVRSDFDIRQGVVRVTAAMPDPQVSAQAADALVQELTDYVTNYRSTRQRRKLDFVQQLHHEARARFDSASRSLASFRDTHRNLARDLARTEEQRLQAEYDMAFSLYNSLSSRLEEAKIELQEQTPVFQILQPVTVPLQKSYPLTFVTLLLCGLLGLLVGSGYLLFNPAFRQIGAIFRSRK